jgi:hypothetical protein
MPTEKMLDQTLEHELHHAPDFMAWFLDRTKFKGRGAIYLWSRSNYPYGKFPVTIKNAQTGLDETVVKEAETDVLVVAETLDRRRLALHIENKIVSGHFTERQAELYSARAAHWAGNPKYWSYDEWDTVLVAPQAFLERFLEDAKKFGARISHEEIATQLPGFGTDHAEP